MEERLSRRALLSGSATAGAALWLHGVDAASGAAASSVRSSATTYFDDPTLNFQTLFLLGSAGYGIAEVGEVLSAVDRVNARGPSYQTFFDELLALGQRLASQAAGALKNGRRLTARERYLRAAEYYSQALYFVLGTNRPTRARERQVYRLMQACWHQATQLFSPSFERLEIGYGGKVPLRGYLLKPDRSRRARPTIILNNGSDAQNVDLYAFGGAAGIARGYNALIFEGPGQGSLLFEHNVRMIPNWEKVVTPVLDALLKRRDVDKRRIAIVGWSFCGASVARAAAYDRRLAAVVLDPGVNSIVAPWNLGNIIPLVKAGRKREVNQIWQKVLSKESPQGLFTIAKRSEIFEKPNFYDQVRYMLRFDLGADTIGRIRAPTLVTEAEDEQFYPGQSQQVYRQLRSKKRLALFTTAEGAEYHDEPMAPQTRNEVVYGWLDSVLKM
jgi:Esterase FrsA-like